MYLGDYAEDATLNFSFTTVNTSGVPTQLGATPSLAVYKSNGTTESTAGITLTADFDAVTGLNQVNIDLSADAFYATGNDYQVVIAAGEVDGTSVVGYVVGTFSIENRFPSKSVGEPAQGAPPATTDRGTKIDYLYKQWRNKSDQNSTTQQLYADDATTVDQKATTSDDGTTFTRGEMGTGP